MGKDPSIWMQAIRFHTYKGRPQYGPDDPEANGEGSIYLAVPDEVENIEIQKFAKRVQAPPRAVRSAEPPPVTTIEKPVEQPAQPVAPLTTASSSPLVQTPRRRGRR
jgi:hypothetical protein